MNVTIQARWRSRVPAAASTDLPVVKTRFLAERSQMSINLDAVVRGEKRRRSLMLHTGGECGIIPHSPPSLSVPDWALPGEDDRRSDYRPITDARVSQAGQEPSGRMMA